MAAHDQAKRPERSARPEWAKARRIVVKIGSSLLVDRAQRRAQGRLARHRWPTTSPALVKAGKQVIVVSSGAIALGRHVLGLPRGALELEKSQAAAAVGQISLASAYQAVLQGARADRRADPADAGRHRGAPPLPQCPPDHRHAAGRARRSRRQRERHGGDHRDPLRRQRPPVRPRRQHDERRLPGAALRHRRPLYRTARQRRRRAAASTRCARSRPRSRPWPAAPAPSCRAAAW